MNTSITFEATHVVRLPVTRAAVGFPSEGDRGNAVLLLAHEMRPSTRRAYQQAGNLYEGVRISSLDEQIFALLEELQAQWCPWPDRGFTLAVWPHSRIGVLADRLIVQRLQALEASAGEAESQGGEVQ
jgi:hypothetical protein